jgi:septation ring formation regulator EzrA
MSSINKDEILASVDVKLKKYASDIEGLQLQYRRYVDDIRSQTAGDVDLKTSIYDDMIKSLSSKISQIEKSLDVNVRTLKDENLNVYNELERLETSISSSVKSLTKSLSPSQPALSLHPKPNQYDHLESLHASSQRQSLSPDYSSNNTSHIHDFLNNMSSIDSNPINITAAQPINISTLSRSTNEQSRDKAADAEADDEVSREFKSIANIMTAKKNFREARFGRK